MKEYDLIVVGSGAGMNVSWKAINQGMKVALVDQGPMGGTCPNNGCIPSKMLIYPADVIRTLEAASSVGIEAHIDQIEFSKIMGRMRSVVNDARTHMEKGAKSVESLDWYEATGEFVGEYQIKAGEEVITAQRIVIASGSRPNVPPIPGLEEAGYLDNISLLELETPPESLIIMGGGYIACEYGHFFSAMGSKVTILGKSPRLLANEETEISRRVERGLSEHIDVRTNHEVVKLEWEGGNKVVSAVNLNTKEVEEFQSQEILVALGRRSNADLLKPENAGVETDKLGWILVDEYLETSKSGIWALGDAIGKHMFRHTANSEAEVVWANISSDRKVEMDYHAVPHAVFTCPQVGSVGMTEEEAKAKGYHILVGRAKYTDVAKGYAMAEEDGFVKVIVDRDSGRILGCHIVGSESPDLAQQVVYLMNAEGGGYMPLVRAEVIHPALSEVVIRAFANLLPPNEEMKT